MGGGAAAHLDYAKTLFDRGCTTEALTEVNESIRLDPKLHLAFFLRAEIAARSSNPAGAEADYLTCLRLSPRYPDAAVRLGDLYCWLDRHRDALDAYARALRLGAENAATHLKIGSARFAVGDYRGANESYRRATHLDPKLAGGGHTVSDYHTLMRTLVRCQARAEGSGGARPVPLTPANGSAQNRSGAHPTLRADLLLLGRAAVNGNGGVTGAAAGNGQANGSGHVGGKGHGEGNGHAGVNGGGNGVLSGPGSGHPALEGQVGAADAGNGHANGNTRAAWIIRDPVRGCFYEAADLEVFLCRGLDGESSIECVSTRASRELGIEVRPDRVQAFVDQLREQGLLVGSRATLAPAAVVDAPDLAAAFGTQTVRSGRSTSLARLATWPFRTLLRWLVLVPWDFISMGGLAEMKPPDKIELFNPDRLLTAMARVLRPILTRAFVYATLPLFVAGLYVLVTRWSAFWFESGTLWRPWNFLTLAVMGICFVHIPHQFAHGLMLIRSGGHVRACGIRFMLHIGPTFYFDLSDTLWVKSRGARLWVIGVGLYFQGLMFSLGLIGWGLTPWGTAWHTAWGALATTAAWGLIFNGNPGIKRDLYYVLSGHLEIRDLRERSMDSLRAWARWLRPPEPLTTRERNWFRTFAVAASLYSMAHLTYTCTTFFYRITDVFAGQGLMLFLFGGLIVLQDQMAYYLETPIRWIKSLFTSRVLRSITWVLVAAAVIGVMFIPYPYQTGGPFVLLPAERLDVRAEIEGLVEEILVREGEEVVAGQPVATVSKRLYERNLRATEAQVQEKRAQLALVQAGKKPEEIAAATQAVETARTQYRWTLARAQRYTLLFKDKMISEQENENAQRQKEVDAEQLEQAVANLKVVESGARSEQIQAMEAEIESLTALVQSYRADIEKTVLRSPIDGRVITPRVEELAGIYLKPGQRDLLMQVENARSIRAEIEVPEEDAGDVRIGAPVKVVTWTFADRDFTGEVASIAPIATSNTAEAPESVPSGGESGPGGQVKLSGASWKVVRIVCKIPNEDGVLKADMTGFGKIATRTKPVWDVLFRPIIRWFQVEFWSWIP
jgi:multidrug resistance efflux pump